MSSSTSRDSTVQGPAIVAKYGPPICRPSTSTTVRVSFDLRRRELVRLEDRHELVDARSALEPDVGHVLAVADHADHGHELAARDVRRRSRRLHALDHRLHLGGGRALFHHNHHLDLVPFEIVDMNPTYEAVWPITGRGIQGARRGVVPDRRPDGRRPDA